MRMLDLFCGRFGWGKVFAARGWEVIGIDLVEPPEIPEGCTFFKSDILKITADSPFMHWDDGTDYFDFICASSPCEQFSLHGMKHFHPNPPYPELGIRLFEHTRALCEASGVPYVMENVRAAQAFVGNARHHCGPFYLWGSAVPVLMAQGISKGISLHIPGIDRVFGDERKALRNAAKIPFQWTATGGKKRKAITAKAATIPPELANCVCDYAERLLEQRIAI
jgi:hypothetical protein